MYFDVIYVVVVCGMDDYIVGFLVVFEVVDELEKMFIVFVVDYGEDFWQYNKYFYYFCFVYQSLFYVFLGFVVLGLIEGGVVEQLVVLIDILLMIFDLFGFEVLDCQYGSSLVLYFEQLDGNFSVWLVFSEYGDMFIEIVFYDGWKLVDNLDGLILECMFNVLFDFYLIDVVEFYDLVSDFLEQMNLVCENLERVVSLCCFFEIKRVMLCMLGIVKEMQLFLEEFKEELRVLGYNLE